MWTWIKILNGSNFFRVEISLKIAEYLVDFILYKWTVTSGWGRVPWKIR